MLLECNHISKMYHGRYILKDCNLNLSQGEILGIMGESGCGKSTLAKIIGGIENPSSGEVLLNGDKYPSNSQKSQFILIFQDAFHSVNPHFTVKQVLTEAIPKVTEDEILTILEEVGLGKEHLVRRARDLSGGQLQRVCIARALLLRPKVIIFDESLTGLDPIIQGKLLRLLFKLRESHQLSYIFISHDFMLCYAICHRVLIIEQGYFVDEVKDIEDFERLRLGII